MFKRIMESLVWRYRQYQDRAFDKKYGLDTSQGASPYLLQVASDNVKFAVPYEPVQVFMFRRMLGYLAIDFSNYTFLDLGSGKGRALLLAAQFDFQRIIGVEFSRQLHGIARANVDSFSKKSARDDRIDLICMDAADYEFPRKNLLLFMYNPFFGPAMQVVVDKISEFVANESCEFVLLYRNPQCSDLLNAVKGLEVMASTGSFKIYRKRQMINKNPS